MTAPRCLLLAAAFVTTVGDRPSVGALQAASRQEPVAQVGPNDQAKDELALAEAGDYPALGLLLNQRASKAFGAGERGRAADYWRRSLAAFERTGDAGQQANVLYNLTFVERDDRVEVVRRLERALALARAVGAVPLEGQILQRWGDEEFTYGEYAAAIGHIQGAVRLLERDGSPDRLARALTSLGRVYRVHGQYDQALDIYRRALALHESTNDVAGLAQSLNAVATGLRRVGRLDEALQVAQRAVRVIDPNDRGGALALASHTLAMILGDLDRTDEALATADRGLASQPNPRDAVLLHESRAGYLSSLGRHREAVDAAEQAMVLAERANFGTSVDRGILTARRASVRAGAADLNGALDDAARAVDLVEERRRQTLPQDALRAGFDDSVQWVYGQHVQLLVRAGRGAEALETSERARARAFADLLATRQLAGSGAAQGATMATSGIPDAPQLQMRGAASPGAAGERSPVGVSIVATASPLSLADMRAQAARLRTTVLAYWVSRDETSVWAVTSAGEVRSARVSVTARHLSDLIRETWAQPGTARAPAIASAADRQPLARRGDTEAAWTPVTRGAGIAVVKGGTDRAFRELYDLLIAPVVSSLPRPPQRRLTIVPHGALFRLSFASLLSPTRRYLVEDYRLHYAPSMSVLATTATGRASEAPRSDFLIVADPALASAVRTAEALGPLPGALAEGRAIATIGGASKESLLVRAGATEGRVRELIGGRRVLHFATHAVISDDHPLDSFLALGGDGEAHETDGRLTAEEVYGLTLDADLVVLSGCRTAGGRVTGDGITGLARAFFYAGTPALVASLWDLPDTAGRFMLPRFYRAWQRTGDKAEALREAQVAFLQALRAGKVSVDTPAGRFVLPEHPAFWSSLVLIGEP